MIYLELERVGEAPEDIKNVLKSALENNKSCHIETNPEDLRLAILYCELAKSEEYLESICNASIERCDLEKARAYNMRGQEENMKKAMTVVYSLLGDAPFTHTVWEDTVRFLKQLRKDKRECWKSFVLEAYAICREQEKVTAILHLRWYWSRQRDLYDLAFLATESRGDYKRMAEIADSVKSLPPLRWSAWEKMGDKEKKHSGNLRRHNG